MSRPFPHPDDRRPIRLPDGTIHPGTVFLRAVVDHPNITVGAYTYASAFDPPQDWAARLAPYLHPGAPERLVIGKFCQIADNVRFVTASANHRYDGLSSYPFAIFQGRFAEGAASLPQGAGPDTVVGNDVWIGQGVTVLPGAQIGDGAILGAGAVVGGVVPPYTVTAGNPARTIRDRLPPHAAARLQAVAWWDWPIAEILAAEALICDGDLEALERFAAAR